MLYTEIQNMAHTTSAEGHVGHGSHKSVKMSLWFDFEHSLENRGLCVLCACTVANSEGSTCLLTKFMTINVIRKPVSFSTVLDVLAWGHGLPSVCNISMFGMNIHTNDLLLSYYLILSQIAVYIVCSTELFCILAQIQINLSRWFKCTVVSNNLNKQFIKFTKKQYN